MPSSVTLNHLLDLAALDGTALSARARATARLSMFDWLVVARAGAGEALSRIIVDYVLAEGGRPIATIVGGAKLPARAAALANGTVSHALDYDDTHFAHIGHLSVGILPAALASGEEVDASAAAVRDAFLVGAEAACRIGMVLGRRHYEHGFHQTATAGAFGATVAAGRLYGLDRQALGNALSLVSTRASGLTKQFGTMGKPFNAGLAASNGVESAGLAKRGFVSCEDGIGGVHGFIATHQGEAAETRAWAAPPPETFVFEDNQYKLHACCHGTHAMIDALGAAARVHDLTPDRISHIALRTNPRWMRVCDIKRPRTGLELKFSYAYLAGMALHGIDTAADTSFTAELCTDPRLARVAETVEVFSDQAVPDSAASLVIETRDGGSIDVTHDLADRVPGDQLERGLRLKAEGLLGETTASRLWDGISKLDRASAREIAALLER